MRMYHQKMLKSFQKYKIDLIKICSHVNLLIHFNDPTLCNNSQTLSLIKAQSPNLLL